MVIPSSLSNYLLKKDERPTDRESVKLRRKRLSVSRLREIVVGRNLLWDLFGQTEVEMR